MRLKSVKRIGAVILALCIALSAVTVFADSSDKLEVIFTNVTDSDLTTLSGEAKIKVSVKGAVGDTTIAQLALSFSGDLKYKSIQFLKGENNPPRCVQYSPNAALANAEHELMPSIISKKAMSFDEVTDLFVLTFSGDAGGSVTLKNSNLDRTYCVVGGQDIKPAAEASVTASASSRTNTGKRAVIKLTMDKVEDFVAGNASGNYSGSGIEVRITCGNGYTYYTVLNNILTSKGGHRGSESVPTFTVENTVLDGEDYTVEVSGIGYVTYKRTGVNFDDIVSITNDDFIPGDVNADGKVDKTDKKAAEQLAANGEYSEAADFNRDGKVNASDLDVFAGIASDENVPAKMPKPTVTGGSKKLTVKWAKPQDDSITGYVIKYGTDSSKLTQTKNVDGSASTSADITGLSANTAYYVQIAAKNSGGTGAFSDIESAKTSAETQSDLGGGGGGGGGGSDTTPSTDPENPGEVVTPGTNDNTDIGKTDENKPFTDLGNHAWAEDSIYALKNRGIINGVSDTEFAPANNIKRGDFILILTKMLGINDEFSENFADVSEDMYYYDAIGSAKSAGVAAGDGDNFYPESSITRQDLITLAYRAFLNKGYISETDDLSSLEAFADKGDVSDYAETAMASMVKAGIINGSDGNLNPKGSATRAEVAVMCAKLIELIK